MAGRQQIKPSIANPIESPLGHSPRSKVNTSKIVHMDIDKGNLSVKKKKHTNTNSLIISIVGCLIVGFIVYKLLINFTGLN